LQIPVSPGRDFRGFVDPPDQLGLSIKAAAVNELARRDRIEQQAGPMASVP
jgi:hypothetical protein